MRLGRKRSSCMQHLLDNEEAYGKNGEVRNGFRVIHVGRKLLVQ